MLAKFKREEGINMAKRLASGLKAKRQSKKRMIANEAVLAKMKKGIKKLSKLTATGNFEEAKKMIPSLYAMIDRATKKRIIHKNTAARRKSRIQKMVK